MGRMRAKQDRAADLQHERGLVILIHGDAGFAGQGVVQETLNLSQLPGYTVGGTLHVIVNNQIGFTTSPSEARSSTYATDVAKMLQVPIFHVNGEDPEAVAQVVRLALDFRHEFKRDVVIDMYGYRRLGHNESDEPSFTQPILYRAIESRKGVREGYLDHLLLLKGVTREDADKIADRRRNHLEKELSEARSVSYKPPVKELEGIWKGYLGGHEATVEDVPTGAGRKRLSALLERQTQLPPDFHPHPKLVRLLEGRRAMARGEQPLDWAAAEALAFAAIAADGYQVRLSGQDVGRGTFSQRHAVLHDYENGRIHIPLQHLGQHQAPVQIVNSPLSEIGVLGFEYGYSLDWPDALILWEAQFGDFWNVAQVIVDQFIASAEDKWRRLSGLVLLLPHGFEGQGPEHSSARLERLLMLGAEDNIQVVYPTTPAQYFHVLRRQVLRRWRKPLAIMTPKSLLRHPQVVSSLDECVEGRFQRVLPDALPFPREIRKVLLCSGKVYYELLKQREDSNRMDVAILRLEQLYPLPQPELQAALAAYPDVPVTWVQEEPENMGASRFLRIHLGERLFNRHDFRSICRPASASPATGSNNSHKQEQAKLLEAAFNDE
jgi:2-oxoglutarate dehydrogenase E1 component